jgi:hypothetical protein
MPARARQSLLVTVLLFALFIAVGTAIVLAITRGGNSTGSQGSSNPGGASTGTGGVLANGAPAACTSHGTGPLNLSCVMPPDLYRHCTVAGSATAGTLAQVSGTPTQTVNCSAQNITYQVSQYPNTAALTSAYFTLVDKVAGLRGAPTEGCHLSGWFGEGAWYHPKPDPTTPALLGGRRACYGTNGSTWFIIWVHERTNGAGVQCDHRDVLGVAEEKNVGIPTALKTFFSVNKKPIGLMLPNVMAADCPAG